MYITIFILIITLTCFITSFLTLECTVRIKVPSIIRRAVSVLFHPTDDGSNGVYERAAAGGGKEVVWSETVGKQQVVCVQRVTKLQE